MPYHATVLSNTAVTPAVFLLKVVVEGEPAFSFKAGQFIVIPLPPEAGLKYSASPEQAPSAGSGQVPGKPLKGFFSIASAEQAGAELELLVEHRHDGGPVSSWMSSRKKGDTFPVQGPLGHFGLHETHEKGQAFLCFRAGVAPLRSMIHSSLAHGGTKHHWLFLGAAGMADLLLDQEWRALAAAEPRFHYLPVIQPTHENPFQGKNSDPADEFLKKIAQRTGLRVYLAGFSKDLEPMHAKLLAAGFAAGDLKMEKFG